VTLLVVAATEAEAAADESAFDWPAMVERSARALGGWLAQAPG
jgi:hypothetical protein